MTWRANTWDLTKKSAFIIAILLCGDVMVFPKAIQSGRVSLWLMSIAILLMTGASWPSIMKVKQKKNSQTDNYSEIRNKVVITEQIKVNPINDLDNLDQGDITIGSKIVRNGDEELRYKLEGSDATEKIEQEENSLKPQKMDEVIALEPSEVLEIIILPDRNEVVQEEAVVEETVHEETLNEEAVNDEVLDEEVDDEKGVIEKVIHNEEELPPSILEESTDLLSIDELLELGFNEKNSENFAQAAAYFMRALALEPRPDIAFYLIMDCYWLWKNIGESDYALSQIMIYAQKYFSIFSLDLQRQFEVWLNKEDLNKYFK